MRYLWIDAWRGILIILVVLGHAVGGAEHFSSTPHAGALDYVYRLIYGFHMAAFFFLAGMLWRPSGIDFVAFVRKKFHRLMVPYFIWGCISIPPMPASRVCRKIIRNWWATGSKRSRSV